MIQYLEKYSDTIISSKPHEQFQQEVLWTIENSIKFVKEVGNLDLTQLITSACQVLFGKNSNLTSHQVKRFLQALDGRQERDIFVQNFLNALKAGKYDVKNLDFRELGELMQVVAVSTPLEIPVFLTYMNQALSLDYWSEESLKFGYSVMSDLVCTLALEGLLEDDQLLTRFLLQTNDKIYGANKTGHLGSTIHDKLIKSIWVLIYRDQVLVTDKRQRNPQIPKLLEHLHTYKRDEPISDLEYCMLYQICLWIDNQIVNEKLPQIMYDAIPEDIRKTAQEKYFELDKPFYKKEQEEVARKLLRLRISFAENEKYSSYRADMSFLEDDGAILLW